MEVFADAAADLDIDAIGLNCSVGPKAMLEALDKLRPLTRLPLSVQPNAASQSVAGRNIYMTSPEYIAEYAKRFILSGASIVGGCCGTNPGHIKAIRRAVQALRPSQRLDRADTALRVETPAAVAVVPRAEKSRLGRKLAAGDFVTLVELVSPKGVSPSAQVQKARRLGQAGIDAINIPDGPRASARMSALALASILERETGIETVLHFACRDRNVIGMQSDLLGAWALGLRNVLVITGDPPKLGDYSRRHGGLRRRFHRADQHRHPPEPRPGPGRQSHRRTDGVPGRRRGQSGGHQPGRRAPAAANGRSRRAPNSSSPSRCSIPPSWKGS